MEGTQLPQPCTWRAAQGATLEPVWTRRRICTWTRWQIHSKGAFCWWEREPHEWRVLALQGDWASLVHLPHEAGGVDVVESQACWCEWQGPKGRGWHDEQRC